MFSLEKVAPLVCLQSSGGVVPQLAADTPGRVAAFEDRHVECGTAYNNTTVLYVSPPRVCVELTVREGANRDDLELLY